MWNTTVLGSGLLNFSFFVMALVLLSGWTWAVIRSVPTAEQRRRALWRWVPLTAGWLVGWCAVAASGVLQMWDVRPPPAMLMMLSLFVVTVSLAFSELGARMASQFEERTLIFVQAFRLPLELLLYQAMLEGLMPPQMSFAGYNFDVLSGVTALGLGLLSLFVKLPRWVVWAFNLLGSVLLLVIVSIAVLSLPLFAAFGEHRVNTWVLNAPYITLPAIMVQFALFYHLLLWRKLLHAPPATNSALPEPAQGSAASARGYLG